MPSYYLVRQGEGTRGIATKVVKDPKVFSMFSKKIAWDVFKAFSNVACPMDVAKSLGIHEQKVYYYVRKFKDCRLIEEVYQQQRHGMIARFYRPASSCFSVIMNARDMKSVDIPVRRDAGLLEPFIANGKMNSRIIVGSPDPHGPYKARASDSCCAIDLALFFGSFTFHTGPNYKLDVEVREHDLKGNLILVGGPSVNMITNRINDSLPVFFDMKNIATITSKATGKTYGEEETGIITIAPNPYDSGGKILLLAGNRFAGTRAAVLALIKRPPEVFARSGGNLSRVVKGFDMNGDGIIDNFEFLE